jgi:hypothetical protein
VSMVPVSMEGETLAGFLLRSFTMVWSQVREGKWILSLFQFSDWQEEVQLFGFLF